MKNLLFCLLVVIPLFLTAQVKLNGIVKDSQTKEPLPFATIILENGIGDLTDTEGNFTINSSSSITYFTVSYVGYKSKKVAIKGNEKFITVLLEPSIENLKEVVLIAEENPAIKIIKKTIENKSSNAIQKKLTTYNFTTYNKLLVTAEPDSISSKIDSVFSIKNGEKKLLRVDSSNYNFKKDIEKHHLYLTEKISEYTYQRGKNEKETILASRMAGFKNPIYELLSLNLEKFSFYEEVYRLLGTNYINPIANNALKNYNYKILDSVTHKDGWAYMIYFKPKKVKETVGLEGVLYINSESYALEKAIAELKGIIHVKASQQFEYKKEYDVWFPVETQILIKKGDNQENVNIFGGMVQFSTSKPNDSIVRTKQKDPSDASYLLSKSKNFDIHINQPVTLINSAATVEIDENASNRNDSFWERYRTDSITKRGLETYRVIDSAAKAEKVEKKIDIARKIVKGYFPTKFVDLDLSQLVAFNNYEGFRLGLGGITNTNFSKKIRLEAALGYGFRDKAVKYRFGSSVRLNRHNNTWIGAGYTNDIQEAAKLDFLFKETSFSLINPRNLNISQFFNYKTYNVNFQHDIFPNLEAKLKFEHGKFQPLFDYQFLQDEPLTNYDLTTGSIAVEWTPFSEYMNSPIGKLAVKKGYPKITAQVTKSFKDLANGDLNFTQYNFKFEHVIKLINKSSTSFLVQGGFVHGDAPLTHLYNAVPNYALKNPWIKRVNFSGTNAFETMIFNEFISDKYISIQARQNFAKFKISNRFRPTLSLVTRFAIGDIEHPENHFGINFKTMNKGYWESGMVMNSLFKGFGLATFYRYGAYSNPKFSDNLAVKLTYTLSLDF
ncbi:MAG: carboxypeptidase-like regulatory domain-containing protein [Flavobacteriaceae bacterium]|nr:carboxypeptidase-like regulatory domain-containing protein [Flavobacteriaceae bacterium]